MFILLFIAIFILKFVAVGVFALFFIEDLELTKSVGGAVYATYLTLGAITFISLFFFVLGKKFLWLILFLGLGSGYLFMYNNAPGISEVHSSNNLKERYFKDGSTFWNRMKEVMDKTKQEVSKNNNTPKKEE